MPRGKRYEVPFASVDLLAGVRKCGYRFSSSGDWDNCVYPLDHFRNPLWTSNWPRLGESHCKDIHAYYNEDTIWSSSVMADLNDDGKLTIIDVDMMSYNEDIASCNTHDADKNVCAISEPTGDGLRNAAPRNEMNGNQWCDSSIWVVAGLNNDDHMEVAVGGSECSTALKIRLPTLNRD